MCRDAKSSLLGWLVVLTLSIILFVRSGPYDRMICTFLLSIGLVQVLEYIALLGGSGPTVAKSMFILLWIQCIIVAIGAYIYTKSIVVLVLIFVLVVSLILSIIHVFRSRDLNVSIGQSGILQWSRGTGSLLGNLWILYLVGIFVPLLIMYFYSGYHIKFLLLIITGIIGAILINRSSYMWGYMAAAATFVVWMCGVIN